MQGHAVYGCCFHCHVQFWGNLAVTVGFVMAATAAFYRILLLSGAFVNAVEPIDSRDISVDIFCPLCEP